MQFSNSFNSPLLYTGGASFIGGDAVDWADAMSYIEKIFMPMMMRSPGHGGRSPAHYFPDLIVGDPKWFRVQLLLFKPHQGIYDGPQPLVKPNESVSEACASCNILCPLCMCPTKKVFQHGCEGEECQTQKFGQMLGMVTRFVLMAVAIVYYSWVVIFSTMKFDGPWAAFELLSATLLGLAVFRASLFLEIMVGDRLPERASGSTTEWLRSKLILNSPDDRFVKPEHRARHIGLQAVCLCAFALIFKTPLGADGMVTIGCSMLMWGLLSLQYYVSL